MNAHTSMTHRLAAASHLARISVACFLFSGCVGAQGMRSGSSVPASEGTVQTRVDANGNTNVDLRVKHLAPASRLAADATVYVVWIQALNAERQNVGAMKLNDNLEGHFAATTPHRRFFLMVTPEPSGQVAQPTHDEVFTAQVASAK